MDGVISSLNEVISLLERVQDKFWPGILSSFRTRLLGLSQADRVESVEILTEMGRLFGGMGTLNDLEIGVANGHVVENYLAANSQYLEMVERLYLAVKEALEKSRQA